MFCSGSYLGTNGFDLSLLYYATYNQPELAFNYNTGIGPLNLYYSLSHTFAELGQVPSVYYRENIGQILYLRVAPVDWYASSAGDYLSVSLGVPRFRYGRYRAVSIPERVSPSTIANGNFPLRRFGAVFSHGQSAGPASFYRPGASSMPLTSSLPFRCWTRRG